MIIVGSHRACQNMCRHEISSSAEGTRVSRKGPLDGAGDPPSFSTGMVESYVLLPRRASQFDPTIDKERKLISNLRQNMLVLLDSPEYAALRADMKGDRLNSRFQHIRKNKSVKAHRVV